MSVEIFGRDRRTAIRTIDDWKRHASTEGKWASGFSAMETALLWLDGAGPCAVADALAPVMPGLTLDLAIAEAQVAFDGHSGGVRNHDVLVYGHTMNGPVVIGVEGKVNESLDATIAQKYRSAQRTKDRGENTNLDRRVDGLLADIAGSSLDNRPELGRLRYQLFTAVAGTVAAAKPDTVAAAVVVHLIRTPSADPGKFRHTRGAVAELATVLGLPQRDAIFGPLTPARCTIPCWLTVIETDGVRLA